MPRRGGVRGGGRGNRGIQQATETTPLLRNPNATPNRTDPIRWIETWRFVRPYITPDAVLLRLFAVGALFCVIAGKFVALLPAYAYKLAVDTLTSNLVDTSKPIVVPYMAVIFYFSARIGSGLLSALQDFCYVNVSSDCTRRFKVDMFAHLQRLSLAFHLHRKTGEVTSVIGRGASAIETVAKIVIFNLFPSFLEVVVVAGIFVKLGTPFIALTVAVTVALYYLITFSVTQWRIKFRRDVIEADNAVSEKAVDTLINYETVKMFGMEDEEISSYGGLASTWQRLYVWFHVTFSALSFGQALIQSAGRGAAMILAARAAGQGKLTPGDFVLVNTYVSTLFRPLFFLGMTYRRIVRAATDLEMCMNMFQTEITVKDRPGARDLVMTEDDVVGGRVGEVRFENVSFQYQGSEKGSGGGLWNVSFTIAPGRMIALVGASGAGKRLYDVDSGAILIDGEDIKAFTQRSLRKHIGVVAQDTVLFNNTLRYNISYGKQSASDPEIFHAARSAALGDFVESLPEKLDTMVGERGVRLSGGEKQRVGCARCIIKAPSIVLLDEASSALDTTTEREMQANLREVCRNRTTIVIAHRLSTVMMADEILVLGKDEDDEMVGKIIERGTHAQLLKADGTYAEMWEAQTIHEESA